MTPKRSQDEDNTNGTNEDSASGSNKKTKKNLRIITYDARSPLKTSYVKFDTAHYTKYDPKKENIGNLGPSTFSKFSDYDELTLFSVTPITDYKIIPRGGVVRLDDYTVAIIAANTGVKERST
ncbi:hypothetical protein ABVK25_008538 [Lepraria finkii]|uniref:Uncharacterized protein n=1 Tax=Lepraria finkii TaxID=1340010 RepID=A0ABR4B340_9LECA